MGDYYGAHVLVGLAAAPFEALIAISIADVWFVHERGSKLGVYVFGLAFGSFMGPLRFSACVKACHLARNDSHPFDEILMIFLNFNNKMSGNAARADTI